MYNTRKEIEAVALQHNISILEAIDILQSMALTLNDNGKLFQKITDIKYLVIEENTACEHIRLK